MYIYTIYIKHITLSNASQHYIPWQSVGESIPGSIESCISHKIFVCCYSEEGTNWWWDFYARWWYYSRRWSQLSWENDWGEMTFLLQGLDDNVMENKFWVGRELYVCSFFKLRGEKPKRPLGQTHCTVSLLRWGRICESLFSFLFSPKFSFKINLF